MKTVTVTIYINRGKGGPEGRVDPWVVELKKKDKDDVEWKLVSGDYPDASADIENKSATKPWPFDQPPPKQIDKDNPKKKSGKIKDDAKEKNQYKVTCTFKDGTPPLVIDPDIIIIGGSLDREG